LRLDALPRDLSACIVAGPHAHSSADIPDRKISLIGLDERRAVKRAQIDTSNRALTAKALFCGDPRGCGFFENAFTINERLRLRHQPSHTMPILSLSAAAVAEINSKYVPPSIFGS
jgi:hypothetical protein